MISRYSGTCFYCHQPTKAGSDQYSIEEKISYHETCRMSVDALDKATEAIECGQALADRLGFQKEPAC